MDPRLALTYRVLYYIIDKKIKQIDFTLLWKLRTYFEILV